MTQFGPGLHVLTPEDEYTKIYFRQHGLEPGDVFILLRSTPTSSIYEDYVEVLSPTRGIRRLYLRGHDAARLDL